jgi:hypothetical protein
VHARLRDRELGEDSLGAVTDAARQGGLLQNVANVAVASVRLVALHVDVESRGHDTVMNAASEMQMVTIQAEGADGRFDDGDWNTEIDERSDGHVAGDSRHGVEEEREPLPCIFGERSDGRDRR